MPFPAVKDHVLLPWATRLGAAAETLSRRLEGGAVSRAVAAVPDEWLAADAPGTPAAQRAAYVDHLERRLAAAATLAEEADRARAELV